MWNRLSLVLLAVACALPLSLAPTASAATEVGSNCAGNFPLQGNPSLGGISAAEILRNPGSPLPLSAPAAGIVTSWRSSLTGPPNMPISQTLKVLRPAAASNAFQVVAERTGAIVAAQNTFPARIPVQAGDRFGLAGSDAVAVCITDDPADSLGVVEGPTPVGTTQTFVTGMGAEQLRAQLPLAVVIEPDADGDGFGDETQDTCPQSAAYQACPRVRLRGTSQVGERSVVVRVSSDQSAPVQVTGTVALGRGKQVRLKAPSRTVSPAKIARFTLKLPARLRARLDQLPAKRPLRLKLTATVTNFTGAGPAKSSVRLKPRR